ARHPLPAWYEDAKFGIFIHWSLSCIPAYAPIEKNLAELLEKGGERAMFANTPYAEWYLNSIRLDGSPAQRHHLSTYGRDHDYAAFAEEFNAAIRDWQPAQWAELFSQAQARYVVLVTKHHDGFTLFNSDTPHPTKPNWTASRDILAELAPEVRAHGMRMGLYYSGSIDWSFFHPPIEDFLSLALGGSTDPEYVAYVDAHYRELIDKYRPSVLWNDIGYPPGTNLYDLFAYYYNTVPEGVINDRWIQVPAWNRWFFRLGPVRKLVSYLIRRRGPAAGIEPPAPPHSDFATPEYTVREEISARKWECVRGIGKSFGFNAEESAEDYLTADELVHMLIDIVSKNGNLLLNVGPMRDGTIPPLQVDRLRSLGTWLATNGAAIFETRPWIRASATTACGLPVRFTRKSDRLFVLILGKPAQRQVLIRLPADSASMLAGLDASARLLGSDEPVLCELQDGLSLTGTWLDSPAQAMELKLP
ncbi:MAG: alpha-L-fucosidase, partial [Pseudomonadales bacterium]|nr:alpha-L-fucosidase [Pseudomonadales bacterium]